MNRKWLERGQAYSEQERARRWRALLWSWSLRRPRPARRLPPVTIHPAQNQKGEQS